MKKKYIGYLQVLHKIFQSYDTTFSGVHLIRSKNNFRFSFVRYKKSDANRKKHQIITQYIK